MKRLVIKDKEGIKKKIQDYFVGNEEARFIHSSYVCTGLAKNSISHKYYLILDFERLSKTK